MSAVTRFSERNHLLGSSLALLRDSSGTTDGCGVGWLRLGVVEECGGSELGHDDDEGEGQLHLERECGYVRGRGGIEGDQEE